MNEHFPTPANCNADVQAEFRPPAGTVLGANIPEFDADLLNAKDIQRLRSVPDSCPTRRVESAGDIFVDYRDRFEGLAQSEHLQADLFQEVVDQLDEMESARDELYLIRDDPSSYEADEKAAAREAVLDAFAAVADALEELKRAVAADAPAPHQRPLPGGLGASSVLDDGRGPLMRAGGTP